MSKHTDTEVSAFLLNSGYPLTQIKRVLKTLGQEDTESKLSAKDLRIARAANAILWRWKQLLDRTEHEPFSTHQTRLAYNNCLIIMQHYGLIEDYDLLKVQVRIKGIWTGARQGVVI